MQLPSQPKVAQQDTTGSGGRRYYVVKVFRQVGDPLPLKDLTSLAKWLSERPSERVYDCAIYFSGEEQDLYADAPADTLHSHWVYARVTFDEHAIRPAISSQELAPIRLMGTGRIHDWPRKKQVQVQLYELHGDVRGYITLMDAS